jgi:glucosylglycerate synthase
MARTEFPEETKRKIEEIGSADILIGVWGAVGAEELCARAGQALAELAAAEPREDMASRKVILACPGVNGTEPVTVPDSSVLCLQYPAITPGAVAELWQEASLAQRSILEMAVALNARSCLLLNADLAALHGQTLQMLLYPLAEKQCDLVTPVYPAGKYDGLINSGILSPLMRALYGRRIRYPLPFDFGVSGRLSARLAAMGRTNGQADNALLWPATLSSIDAMQIGQIHLDVQHKVSTEGLELSAVLSQLVGSAFLEMEQYAAQWQRVRVSQPTPIWGSAAAAPADGEPVDAKPMIDSFQLGSKNLDEVWRLVLPPVTLLELKHLTRLAPEQFRMPDALWVRIVYDFALAHRLRTISRVHLLGALVPLYLGWVASYVQEVANATPLAAEQRLEQLARAYEDNKPYLVSRWRWPDRFNP